MLVWGNRAKYRKYRTNSFSKEILSYGLVVYNSLREDERKQRPGSSIAM
jgi:hypothetical protein